MMRRLARYGSLVIVTHIGAALRHLSSQGMVFDGISGMTRLAGQNRVRIKRQDGFD